MSKVSQGYGGGANRARVINGKTLTHIYHSMFTYRCLNTIEIDFVYLDVYLMTVNL